MNYELEAAVRRLSDALGSADVQLVLCALIDARDRAAALDKAWAEVAAAATDAEADAQRLAERVRSVRLMFETAGMHRTAEDMDDVLDQHDTLVSKRVVIREGGWDSHLLEFLLEALGEAEAIVVRRDGDRVVIEEATREVGGFSTAHRWVGPWIEEEA